MDLHQMPGFEGMTGSRVQRKVVDPQTASVDTQECEESEALVMHYLEDERRK
jgi:hypothetical protein